MYTERIALVQPKGTHPMTTTVAPSPLPADYAADLEALSLLPGWALLRVITPETLPNRIARPFHWAYEHMRPLLLRAGELVPMEEAERRVLALLNPGYAMPRLAATPTIFVGLQLILPGESAPGHRHSPAAARLIIEGEGAVTIVDGQAYAMEPGDLVLTPQHHWHEHAHNGASPMIWMDILDHPIGFPMEAAYLVDTDGPPLSNAPAAPLPPYVIAGLLPYRDPGQAPPRHPMLRYPWREVRSALFALAARTPGDTPVHFRYANPETGADCLPTLAFSVRMLRPGETLAVEQRSASAVFHVLEGRGESEIDGLTVSWSHGDVFAAPTFARTAHFNNGPRPAFLFQIDDAPMQHKLGFFERRELTEG